MKLRIHHNAENASRELVGEILQLRNALAPSARQSGKAFPLCLGFATGSSMLPIYAQMREFLGPELAGVGGFNLDEFFPQQDANNFSFANFMRQQFPEADHPAKLPGFSGAKNEVANFCQSFEDEIVKLGGIDLQLLGIGINGHIGFNEPGSEQLSQTRLVNLSESTLQANPDFSTMAITQGIATILNARRIRICAFGEHKAEAVATAIEGPVSVDCPASFLQQHRDVIWFLDKASASRLTSK